MTPKISISTIGTAIVTSVAAGATLYYLYTRNVRKTLVENVVDELISLLDDDECHITDVAVLRGKIKRFVEDGVKKLQIVTDFDQTLTKAFVYGQAGHSSFGVVEDSSYVPDSVVQELNALRDKYLPIEMSTDISEEEKIPLMIEWWSSSMNIAASAGIQKRLLPDMVRESRAVLRDGSDQFFHIINENKIPLFIISAGVGDIVEEVLRQQAEIPSYSKVVANFYSHNENEVVNGIKDELIHGFNKNEVSKNNHEYFHNTRNHSNVILMGDTLGDPAMADGIKHVNNIIKIGFLNRQVEKSLPSYLSAFDIVLTNDATMDRINVFLQKLVMHQ